VVKATFKTHASGPEPNAHDGVHRRRLLRLCSVVAADRAKPGSDSRDGRRPWREQEGTRGRAGPRSTPSANGRDFLHKVLRRMLDAFFFRCGRERLVRRRGFLAQVRRNPPRVPAPRRPGTCRAAQDLGTPTRGPSTTRVNDAYIDYYGWATSTLLKHGSAPARA